MDRWYFWLFLFTRTRCSDAKIVVITTYHNNIELKLTKLETHDDLPRAAEERWQAVLPTASSASLCHTFGPHLRSFVAISYIKVSTRFTTCLVALVGNVLRHPTTAKQPSVPFTYMRFCMHIRIRAASRRMKQWYAHRPACELYSVNLNVLRRKRKFKAKCTSPGSIEKFLPQHIPPWSLFLYFSPISHRPLLRLCFLPPSLLPLYCTSILKRLSASKLRDSIVQSLSKSARVKRPFLRTSAHRNSGHLHWILLDNIGTV